DPGDVPAVADRVFQSDHGEPWATAFDERANRLVRAGRVLDQEQQDAPVADRDALESPESRVEALEADGYVVEPHAEGTRERCGGDRVVDVVEPRHTKAHPARSLRRLERERGVLEPGQ